MKLSQFCLFNFDSEIRNRKKKEKKGKLNIKISFLIRKTFSPKFEGMQRRIKMRKENG